MSAEKPVELLDERIQARKRAILYGHTNRLPGRPRLGEPAMSDPVTEDTKTPVVITHGAPVVPQWLTIVMTVLAALSAVVPMIPGMPPVVSAIAAAVASIAAAFGIASPGIRKSEPTK